MRFMGESILRISGATISGHPYYVYHKLTDDGIIIKGKILIDGKFIPLEFKSEETTKIIETAPAKEESPELIMLVTQDHTTFWRDYYTVTTKVFDAKINQRPQFHDGFGAIDGVTINVKMTSEDGSTTKTFSGITHSHGFWQGEAFFPENISKPGKYLVNIVASYLGNTVSQNFVTFVIGEVRITDGTNSPPIANAGPDQSVGINTLVTLDGTGSNDPEGATLTFSWVQTSGTSVTLSDSTAASPTFTSPGSATTLVFQLTVSDGIKTASDTVTITVSQPFFIFTIDFLLQ